MKSSKLAKHHQNPRGWV